MAHDKLLQAFDEGMRLLEKALSVPQEEGERAFDDLCCWCDAPAVCVLGDRDPACDKHRAMWESTYAMPLCPWCDKLVDPAKEYKRYGVKYLHVGCYRELNEFLK